jgi:hypothetical protein
MTKRGKKTSKQRYKFSRKIGQSKKVSVKYAKSHSKRMKNIKKGRKY